MNSFRGLALVGMMGAGKTSVGFVLSQKLNMHFVDSDEFIVSKESRTIAEIFVQDGEEYFRRQEYFWFKEILSSYQNYILATGGGSFIQKNIRTLLKKKLVTIWLQNSYSTLIERLRCDGGNRPLLKTDDFFRMLKQREVIYSTADITINCEQLSVDDISNIIIKRVKNINKNS